MDFGGVLGMEVLMGSSPCSFSPPQASTDLESIRQRSHFGSHFFKQGRSSRVEDDDWRCPKIARSISLSCASNGEQMLSFSSSKASSLMHSCDSPSALTPFPSPSSASSQVRSAGLNPGDLNVKDMQGVAGGSFTLSQRVELEQQMLIYNYICARAPIPTNLLSSLGKGINPACFSVCTAGSFRPNAALWGYFHPGLVGNADPEPGRCRRTDGKKWRCSRDAVPDQKYCERHINRGRHRSRKPVEGQGGHAKKAMPVVTDSTSASPAPSGGQLSNSASVSRQMQNPQAATTTSPSQFWMLAGENVANDCIDSAQDSSIPSSTTKPFDSLFPISKSCNIFKKAFSVGLDSGNTTPSHERRSFVANSSIVTPLDLHDQRSHQPHTNGHFIDYWTPGRSDCSTILWPDSEKIQSGRTDLSMTFPMASPDFSSSTSSPATERLTPLHTLFRPGGVPNDLNSVQRKWRATPWETPNGTSATMGGPLGEALTSASGTAVDVNKSFLSLMNDGWDLSPQLASSTSNAMQSTTLSSVSSGSANDLMVEKNSNESLSCLFGPTV